MSLFKDKSGDENQERPLEDTSAINIPQNVDVGTAADVEAVMKKYDRESNVRVSAVVARKVAECLRGAA